MNGFLFCLIFIQVSIFFIAAGVLATIGLRFFLKRKATGFSGSWSYDRQALPAFSRVYANGDR